MGVPYTVAQLQKLKRVEVDGLYVHIDKVTPKGKVSKLPNLLERESLQAVPDNKVIGNINHGTFLLPTGSYIDVKYKFDINPCPAPRMTQSDKWKTDPYHADPDKRQRKPVERCFKFRNKFVQMCKEVGYDLTPVLDILFVIPFPKSYSKKKRKELNNQQHQIRPDRDNFLKSVQDSFGVDDGFVWDGRTIKIWGYTGQIIIF